jgi:hypothetical protein
MIEAYIGKMRSGKTYAMTERVLQLLKSGEVVFTNYDIQWNPEDFSPLQKLFHKLGLKKCIVYPQTNLRRFNNWEEVMNFSNATIALDEGWQYFDSYQKLTMEKRMRLYQSGKRELQFLYTVQRYMMTDINLRWATDFFHESTMYNIPFKKFPLIIYRTYDLDDDNDGAKIAKTAVEITSSGQREVSLALKTKWLFTKQKIYDAYDTKADIYATDESRGRLAERIDARNADTSGTVWSEQTYWHVFRILLTGKPKKYDKRRFVRNKTCKKRLRRVGKKPVVDRFRRRNSAVKRVVVSTDGVIH